MERSNLSVAEQQVRDLHGTEFEAVLDVEVRPDLVWLAEEIEAVNLEGDLAANIEPLVLRMLAFTRSGSVLDPRLHGADVPWGRLLRRLAPTNLDVACRTARRLAAHYFGLMGEMPAVGVVQHAVAHMMVGLLEGLRRNAYEAEVWRQEAVLMCEIERAPEGLALAVSVRAAKLLAGGTPTPITARLPS